MATVRHGLVLVLLVLACTPSRPTGDDYPGVWTGASSSGCACMLSVAAYGRSYMIRNESPCKACSLYEGVYTLSAEGNLTGGSTGAVTLVYDKKKQAAMLGAGSSLQFLKKLSAQALGRWRGAQRLITAYAFELDDQGTERCSVDGEAGRCALVPFPMAGRRSCDMFASAKYAGDCVDGTLSGLCLISKVDHVTEGDVAMGYFVGGRVLYPTYIANTSDTAFPFGLQARESLFYNCHRQFSSDDDQYGCYQFIGVFGNDIFSRETHASLRNGTFDLAKYRGRLQESVAE